MSKTYERVEIRGVIYEDVSPEEFFDENGFYESEDFSLYNISKELDRDNIIALCISKEDVTHADVVQEVSLNIRPAVGLSRKDVYDIFVEKSDRLDELVVHGMSVERKDYQGIKGKIRELFDDKGTEVEVNEEEYNSREEVPDEENRIIANAEVYYDTFEGEVKLEYGRPTFVNATLNQVEEVVKHIWRF